MSLLNSAGLAALRRLSDRGKSATCTVYDPPANPTRKTSGAKDDSYPTAWTPTAGVSCSITPDQFRGEERTGPVKVIAESRYIVRFPAGASITESSRFRITACKDNPDLVGEDFHVYEVISRDGQLSLTVKATKVTG